MIKKIAAILAGVCVTLAASADTFNLFSPVNGVLKGNANTYVTTPAASSDIIPLWTGTCDDETYLRGDGTCATPPGTGGGTVDSVGLSAPSVFSVTGSPVTSTGVLALDFAAGQTANRFLATPNGSTGALGLRAIVAADLPAINLTSGVTGTLPVANGGSGAATLTGVLKGNGTSAFSAAASTDITALWSGTCNASAFLRGDGACAAAGTVTSVALTVPSGFSVTGSPVTSSGTLAITGTLNVAAGGTGVGTITGPIKGNGTSAFSAAVAADIYGLWSGLCSSSTYLRGDGSCQTPDGTTAPANPTAVIGLTAVNGSAGTFMRSDAAPALDQGIAPTWTGIHTFTGSSTFLQGTAPRVRFNETDAGTNEKFYEIGTSGGQLLFSTLTDAQGAGSTFMTVDRTGTTVDSVVITPPLTVIGDLATPNLSVTSNLIVQGVNVRDAGILTSGTLPVARGGTGTTTSTGSGSVVLSASPTLTGTLTAASIAATGITVNSQSVCLQNGTNCPSGASLTVSYARVTANGSGCSYASPNQGFQGSCSRNGTGSYTLVFSSQVATKACVSSGQSPNNLATANANSVSVTVGLSAGDSGTFIDGNFQIHCFGP